MCNPGQVVSDMAAQFTHLDIAANITSNLSALYDLRPHNAAVDLMDLGITVSSVNRHVCSLTLSLP